MHDRKAEQAVHSNRLKDDLVEGILFPRVFEISFIILTLSSLPDIYGLSRLPTAALLYSTSSMQFHWHHSLRSVFLHHHQKVCLFDNNKSQLKRADKYPHGCDLSMFGCINIFIDTQPPNLFTRQYTIQHGHLLYFVIVCCPMAMYSYFYTTSSPYLPTKKV